MSPADQQAKPGMFLARGQALLWWIAPLLMALLSASHLGLEPWFDECYTLYNYTNGLHAFTAEYFANNHVVFSALLTLWRAIVSQVDPSIFGLRILPFLTSLAAVIVLGFAVRRLAGQAAGILAAILLATSHVALNFSCQLRGYAFSWLPVAGALWFLTVYLERPRRSAAFGFAACSILAVGIVPTNLLACFALSGWLIAARLLQRPGPKWRESAKVLGLAATPLLGLAWYLTVWREMFGLLVTLKTKQAVGSLLGQFVAATVFDLWPLWLLLPAGFVILVRDARNKKPEPAAAARRRLLFVLACVSLPVLGLLVRTPFPRNLVPLLPLWFAALAVLTAAALHVVSSWKPRLGPTLWVILLAVLSVMGVLRETSGGTARGHQPADLQPHNLYDAYYLHDFYPSQAIDALYKLAEKEQVVALADDSDIYALWWANGQRGNLLRVVLYTKPPPYFTDLLEEALQGRLRFVFVARGPAQAREVARHLRLPLVRPPRELLSTGFFKLYDCPLRPSEVRRETAFTPSELRADRRRRCAL